MARMKFMNTEIDNLTMEEAINEINALIGKKDNAYIVTPNVDHIVRLEKDPQLQKAYENANLILTDGKPLLWISKLYRTPIKEKISGSDLFPKVCELAANKGYTMFFLGAAEGVADKAAKNLTKRFPNLKVVNTYSPPYGFERNKDELIKTINIVRASKSDILIIGLGCPKQEIFMYKYRKYLEVPLSLGLGASLDFEAGNVKRAPKWMSDHGLEWLYRITQDPVRMAKRYLIDDMKIVPLAIKYYKPSRKKEE